MILLSSIIGMFEDSLLNQYKNQMLPSHHRALNAMRCCRTHHNPVMQASCEACNHRIYIPHSCGHRSCPHCQHHESQQWLERQLKKRVPAEYFLITFTMPAQFRSLAWFNQQTVYSAMMQNCWETLKMFSHNDKKLQGLPGAIAVLHTHARYLDFHPHVHVVIPAAAIDRASKLWRTKKKNSGKSYLFCHKALAKVFRAKMLDAFSREGLALPMKHPEKWVVDCKSVGAGSKALTYLGRYLYRGVIREKDIIACKDGQVTFRYREGKTHKTQYKTVTGEKFLWLLLRHVLPKRFRRARNFGFLHPNSKRLIQVLQLLFGIDPNQGLAWRKERPAIICPCCNGEMKIVRCGIRPTDYPSQQLLI